MLCNMRSKLIPTDHIYIHKYRNFLSFDVSQTPHVLKKFVDYNYELHNNAKIKRF